MFVPKQRRKYRVQWHKSARGDLSHSHDVQAYLDSLISERLACGGMAVNRRALQQQPYYESDFLMPACFEEGKQYHILIRENNYD